MRYAAGGTAVLYGSDMTPIGADRASGVGGNRGGFFSATYCGG